MHKPSAITLTLNSHPIVIVGVGGIGFNIAKILIEDDYPLDKLICIDPDKSDTKTLYKYGYSPNITNDYPKVNILRDMARRKYLLDHAEEADSINNFYSYIYKRFMPIPFDTKLLETSGIKSIFSDAYIFDCVDKSTVSEQIYAAAKSSGGKYISVKFDGDILSVADKPEGEYSGYQIGSSSYTSHKAALLALEYAALLSDVNDSLPEAEKSYTINLNDIGVALKEMETREEAVLDPYEALHIIYHYYKDAIKHSADVYDRMYKVNNPKKRNYFTYIAQGNVYYKPIQKKLKSGILLEGYHLGDKDISGRDKEVQSFFAETPVWHYKYKGINVTVPLLTDASMVSLIPPLPEIPGLDADYLRDIYALAIGANLNLHNPYLYPYLEYLSALHGNIGDLYKNWEAKCRNKDMELPDKEIAGINDILGKIRKRTVDIILLLGYIRIVDSKAYNTLIRKLSEQKALQYMPEDDLFLHYYAQHALEHYKNYHGLAYSVTASAKSYLPSNSGLVYDIYDDLVYGTPIMVYHIEASLVQAKRLTQLGGNIVAVAGGTYGVDIPAPAILELSQKFYYNNKFASTTSASLYNLATIYYLVQYAMGLAYDQKKGE